MFGSVKIIIPIMNLLKSESEIFAWAISHMDHKSTLNFEEQKAMVALSLTLKVVASNQLVLQETDTTSETIGQQVCLYIGDGVCLIVLPSLSLSTYN